jgi:hypothetical protein
MRLDALIRRPLMRFLLCISVIRRRGDDAGRACYLLSAFIGAGLVFAGATDWCGIGMLLAKMPWNNRGDADACSR